MARVNWKPGNMLYPLPAVMVSCQRDGEKPNIITLAWVGNICTNPPMLSISVKPVRYSHDIIKESGEFVVNLVNDKLVKTADWCGVKSGKDVDKFKERNLTPIPSHMVGCPSIKESPVSIECKVKQVIELGSHDMFIADVLSVSVDEKYIDEDGRFNMGDMGMVSYNHGEYYKLGDYKGKFGYSVQRKKR